jgi:hypothetical protein
MANFATLMHGELADVLRELERGDCDTQELGAALCNVIRKVQSTPPPNLPYPFPAAGGGLTQCGMHDDELNGGKEQSKKHWCTYPACYCPFDAPADPNWCARGFPHKTPNV